MKKQRIWITAALAMLLCGCFQVEDELSLQPDGSGRVTLTLRTCVTEDLLGMLSDSSRRTGGSALLYPPMNEGEAREFFPGKDFVLKLEQKTEGDDRILVVGAAFQDVNALLASPYARAHQLTLKTNVDGTLRLLALSGASAVAQLCQLKPDDDLLPMELPNVEELGKRKGEMRFAFRVVMPNPVTQANGEHTGAKAVWSTDRAKCKDDEEFAGQLAGLYEASCSMEGVKFSPRTPVRLGLAPFNKLEAGQGLLAAALPDTNSVVSTARFVPCLLQVTRTVDLSGEGYHQESFAQLTGAIVLPAELVPQRWGAAKLDEAIDAKGNSLVPKEDADSAPGIPNFDTSPMLNMDGEEASLQKQPAEKLHFLRLRLKAPEWKVKEVAKIKGSVELRYFGGAEIIKLTNAVPASLVLDMNAVSSFRLNADSDRGHIAHPRLSELGLSLRIQMAMVQGGATMLYLETGGAGSTLVDAQVFDAFGKPWPTILPQSEFQGNEEQSCQIMVAGKPKPPLSLAVAVSGVGATITVPILVQNIPVGSK